METAWKRLAKCRGKSTDVFFPERASESILAKAICRGCPVTDQCYRFAMEHREPGVWGGTTAEERGRIRSNRKVRNGGQDSAGTSGEDRAGMVRGRRAV